MNYDDLHPLTMVRMRKWSETLVVAEESESFSGDLHANYEIWITRHGWKPLGRNLWGRWMGNHYKKRRSRGLTAYAGIEPGYDPFGPKPEWELPQTVIPESEHAI